MHMPKYDPDIHHRRSIRLTHYDYAQAGCYFVTLCAVNRECLFGEILAGEMHLNELGMLVQHEWLQTPVLRPNVSLGEWVVMPNHFHGIVQIDEERGLDLFGSATIGNILSVISNPMMKSQPTLPIIRRSGKWTVCICDGGDG